MNSSRPRTLWRGIAAAVSLAALCAPGVHADSGVPPGTPPDIAAIMRKVQRGGQPTGADIAKLQAWSQKLIENVNGPVKNGSQFRPSTRTTPGSQAAAKAGEQEGIPCTVRVSVNYSGRGHDSSEDFQATYTARAMLYPRLNGTGDYWATMMNPDAQVSSFRFEPLAADSGAAIARAGGGSYHKHTTGVHGSYSESTGTYTQAAFSMQLVTTGKGDRLYPSGGVGGAGVGTTTMHDRQSTNTVKDSGVGTSLSLPFVSENAKLGPGTSTPMPMMTLSYQALVAAIRSGGTATVTGSEGFSNFSLGGLNYGGQSSISITLRPKPMEILIEPVNKRLYEAWEPLPDTDDAHASALNTDAPTTDFFPSPAPLAFHVVMHDDSKAPVAPSANGLTRPNTQIGGLIDIYLHEVSEQLGICMNYPTDARTKKGLFFPHTQPAGITWVDEQHVKTTSATALDATVNVCARDTGAYGKIDAKCELLGLDSKSVRNTDTYLAIPLDDDNNNIADQYEKDNGIYDRRLAANWDEEDKPANWRSNGDGLTLYEEYRGFLIDDPNHKEVFQRLDQKKRKLFVYLNGPDHDIYRQGAELFKNASGLDVYYLHDPKRMKPMAQAMHPRWMNFNKTPYSDYDQAAVWIDDYDDNKTAYTKPMPGIDEVAPQCPVTTDAINISRPKNTEEVFNWTGRFPPRQPANAPTPRIKAACIAMGIDFASIGDTITARNPELVNQLMVFSVAHELGHATGARHHAVDSYVLFLNSHPNTGPKGDPTPAEAAAAETEMAECYSSGDHNCLMRYWNYDNDLSELVSFYAGRWHLTTASTGNPWTFCPDDLMYMHLKK
ncbi:hypothetical protein CCAX7_56860 [Capsulimonas corticalis]|uniref:Uncharacterized protein n=1 Tax=Capsulimonas corticalis TaxID=2219043 RepID=A0A402D0D3_9BACT|nr:hypothetical protein [Capsulimonas corticalis]BDI33635.1 hypothetical protein CCAX7_56860 [Capsulimonas corticalis]